MAHPIPHLEEEGVGCIAHFVGEMEFASTRSVTLHQHACVLAEFLAEYQILVLQFPQEALQLFIALLQFQASSLLLEIKNFNNEIIVWCERGRSGC